MTIPKELTGKELFAFLVANKGLLMAEKKMQVKQADAFFAPMPGRLAIGADGAIKAVTEPLSADLTKMDATLIINTTNWMDSHDDVHLPGIWKRSLKNKGLLYLLQEHEMSFKGIISDAVKGYTMDTTFAELGYPQYKNTTQALAFDVQIDKARNEFMFEQYRKGYVKNHSVGMRYVDIEMAINDEDYKDEFAAWKKYIDQVANRDAAEAQGYFFPVKEAQVIEGSAVPMGSNIMTPTYSMTAGTGKVDPSQDTPPPPPAPKAFDVEAAINNTKFFVNN